MEKKQTGAYFRFKKNDNIGSADAESDEDFLRDCFVDTGDLETLRNLRSAPRIIVGRTGSGKSALIRTLADQEENVIELRPEDLSLSFLANSSVLRFFEEAGTHLDVYYQLLWKHVLAVELIRKKFKITNESAQQSFLSRLATAFSKDKNKERAISYLNEWGDNFWNETESRVRAVTTRIENDLKESLTGTLLGSKLETGGNHKLSTEEKHEVRQLGSKAVNEVQLAALSNVLRLMEDEIFDDKQAGYYVVIDDLDTNWTEESRKYKLIRALIETIKAFRQVRQVKIIIALRLDLLQRVITATRDSGFQSEKYESLYLRLRWNQDQLIEIVSKRLNHLVKQRYTSRPLSIDQIFPAFIQKMTFPDFLCQRTSLRPRDAILFINECLSRAAEKNQINTQIVVDAEAAYSEKRIDSLQEEWSGTYPQVADYLRVLSRMPSSFPVSELSKTALEDWITTDLLEHDNPTDPVARAARTHYVDGRGSFLDFTIILLDALYNVGAIGIKPDSTSPVYWAYFSDHRPASGAIRPSSTVHIHPTFWRALGIRVK